MKVTISKTKFKNLNDRYLPLVLVDGLVEPTAASYLLNSFNRPKSVNTVEAEAKIIKRFYEFCIQEDIPFFERMEYLEPFTIGELESLFSFYSARSDTGELVASNTLSYRWLVTKQYIDFIWRFHVGKLNDEQKFLLSDKKKLTMDSAFKVISKIPYRTGGKDKIGLTPELRIKFLSIINPLDDNELNPWEHQFTRWRNYCLFLTMILGGNRKGESLGLKLKDFNLVGSESTRKYFQIVKDSHEQFPHKSRPAVKTKEREVDLSPDLASIFEYYITQIRVQAKNYKKSDYMFLTLNTGKPLGLTAPNDGLKTLIEKYPEFSGKLSPHRLRNTYFDALRDSIDSKMEASGPIAKQGIINQLMQYAGGWSSGSRMPDRYAAGSIQRKVASFNLQVQSSVLGTK